VAEVGAPVTTPTAVEVSTLSACIAELPEGQRRLLTRQLVAEDAMLQETLLAEAERRVGSRDETRRLTAELQQLHRTVVEITTEQDRRRQTIDQLEEHLAAARVRQAELDTVVAELQRTKQELERGRTLADAEVQTLRARVQQLTPLDRFAGLVHASVLVPPILALVEVTAKQLFPALFRYLQPTSAPTVAKELLRVLDEVEMHVQQCRQQLQDPPVLDQPFRDFSQPEEDA
jgi:septal ring factor EnvC (AmiA/AmiB activator)